MHKFLVIALLCLLTAAASATKRPAEIDRSGSVYVSPKFGISYPMGALADANYKVIAASWRKEGMTIAGDVGYYISNSTIAGMEVSYSNFHPKSVSIYPEGTDKSRVRIRRVGVFMQYSLVPEGKYRPYMKLGAGLFEANRISMPQLEAGSIQYKDYSLGAKPVFSIGLGISGTITSNISLTFSIEAVSLNSFSASWETSGATVGPLRENMLYFPVYFGLMYHLSDN